MSTKRAPVVRTNSLISLTTALLLTSGSALAGFEWNPPQIEQPERKIIIKSHTNKTIDMASPTPKAEEVIDEQPVAPEIKWYQPPEIKEPAKETIKVESPELEVTSEKKKTLAITDTKQEATKIKSEKTVKQVIKEAVASMDETSPAVTKKSNYTLAQGFGKDVPLALALRQIVPADFGYAVQNNANLGLRVDWSGNKPWDEVLNAAIKKYNLEAVIIQKTVLIKEIGAPIETPKRKETAPPVELEQKSEMIREDETITQNVSENAKQKPTSLTSVSKWKAEEGEELYPVMVQWCNAAGVKLLWNAKEKYEISEDIEVNGNFENAVQKVLMTFKGQSKRPVGMFKANDPKGKAVLSVNDSAGA